MNESAFLILITFQGRILFFSLIFFFNEKEFYWDYRILDWLLVLNNACIPLPLSWKKLRPTREPPNFDKKTGERTCQECWRATERYRWTIYTIHLLRSHKILEQTSLLFCMATMQWLTLLTIHHFTNKWTIIDHEIVAFGPPLREAARPQVNSLVLSLETFRESEPNR